MTARRHDEMELLHAIRDALCASGALVWRNNSGVAEYGRARVRYGLGTGSADLVGLYRGRFVSVEVKSPSVAGHARGGCSQEQALWLAAVRAAGGVAVVAYCLDDALEAVLGVRRG